MAIADIRQRPGVVLGAAILLHVVLISAQVNTASGLPVLQVVTFGGFSEVQRATMATSLAANATVSAAAEPAPGASPSAERRSSSSWNGSSR